MSIEQKLHIAYDDIGSGDPTVVLIHGMFANRTYYSAQAEHLAARARVLNIDLRGHGESDVPEQGYSLELLADDVARLCDERGITRAVFCGHSMPVALRVAIRRPDLAAGVVLLDGVVLMQPAATEGQRRLVQALESDAWRDALLGFFPTVAGPAAARIRAELAVVPRCYAAPILRDIIAASDTGRDAEELTMLRCPLMYVHSQVPTMVDRLREIQPDAIVEEIPGVGHWQMLTAPERVNALLDRFLEVIA